MTEHHNADEYVAAIRKGNQTTAEVADALGVTEYGARKRLKQLREWGQIEGEKLGNTLVWSLPADSN